MAHINIESEFITDIAKGIITPEKLIKSTFEANYLEYYGEIYEWLIDYQTINSTLPTEELITTRYPEFQFSESKNNPDEVIAALRKNSELNRFNEVLTRSGRLMINQGSVESARNYLSQELEKFDTDDEQDVFDLSNPEDSDKLVNLYKIRHEKMATQGFVGIPTGFGSELDSWLNGGSMGGNLYGILAPLGVGKTWSSMVIGGTALFYGFDPFMLFLEGNLEKEGYRSLSVGSNISNSGLHTATLSVQDVQNAVKFFQRRANGHHYYLGLHGNRSVYTPRILKQKLIKTKAKICIVDYLSLMGAFKTDKMFDEWQVYSYISRELKKIAVSLDIPVWATLQSNKAAHFKEELAADDSSYYNLQRDFDTILGLSRVKGKQYLVRLNAVKGRDNKDIFKGIYRTNWDEGKVVFEGYAEDEDDTHF